MGREGESYIYIYISTKYVRSTVESVDMGPFLFSFPIIIYNLQFKSVSKQERSLLYSINYPSKYEKKKQKNYFFSNLNRVLKNV